MIIQLTRMWLVNVVTAEMLGAQTSPGRDQQYTVKGEVRTYAAGRQRAVGSLGQTGSWAFTLEELTLAQVTTLRTWMAQGVTVLARDHRGQSMYGTYFAMKVGERVSQTYGAAVYTVDIDLQAVDVVEGV